MGTSGFPEAQLFSNNLHAHHLVSGDLPSLRVCPSQHSVPSHLTVPAVTSPYNPIARPNFSLSPLGSRLASRPVRNGFVNLRTARSLRVNLHLFSQGCSYCLLQTGLCVPEKDAHLSDETRPQAYCHWRFASGYSALRFGTRGIVAIASLDRNKEKF